MGYVLIAGGLLAVLYGKKRSFLESHERKMAYLAGLIAAIVGIVLAATS